MNIANPKRGRVTDSNSKERWYPYYAGFSGEFVSSVLSDFVHVDDFTVLDPWNGSGTTTAQAAKQGFNCVGVDLNPVMAVIAKAKALPRSEYSSLRSLFVAITKASVSQPRFPNDPLLAWFSPDSCASLRAIELSIQQLLVDASSQQLRSRSVEQLSSIASFFYLVLFRVVRRLLRTRFSSNPTWLLKSREGTDKLDYSSEEVSSRFQAEFAAVVPPEDYEVTCISSAETIILVGNSESLSLETDSIDLVLSSPPYCTRIDYAVGTSAELAVLGFGVEINELRRGMMGSSTVPKLVPPVRSNWGPTCAEFLHRVKLHPSKASSTYYYKNHLQYFQSLQKSIAEISRVLRPTGECFLVVQDSYYKDVHNDLSAIICEMAQSVNLALAKRVDFPVSRTLAGVHPSVKKYRKAYGATESVLAFSHA